MYNEIITDKGRQWAAALPDGTIASLNAGSSLRYPLQFTGKERLVEMTGEAYFEVVHNGLMPFRVKARDQVVEDIGTVFNINAYEDEMSIKTTLVEGMASVTKGSSKVTVKADQQAGVYDDAVSIKVTAVDANSETAWIRGLFSFNHSDIPSIMRQLVRWYNVEVLYPSGVPDETFTGEMNRTLTLKEALDVMKNIGIHYRIEEGKRIVILP
jgi:ferric-dicitrate binding protein FerR (iron transport regulator)